MRAAALAVLLVLPVVPGLLDAGADVTARSRDGMRAADVASTNAALAGSPVLERLSRGAH